MDQNQQKLSNVIEIVKLAESLTPIAVALIKQLADRLSGKTDDEVLAEADSIFADIQAKARAAQK